ncbi:hypothetical protein BpHYR1_033441 [Brachionus plicatilis]|uniref:Uncharacterized protein n=1 Tax=Brachionus plicatilis TaxID=10195 RepID=A0A3M7RQD5_BRAPC|nr:hypothetical protein BpHYR1_033441 [Brachionus plicatilis]
MKIIDYYSIFEYLNNFLLTVELQSYRNWSNFGKYLLNSCLIINIQIVNCNNFLDPTDYHQL